MKVQIGFNPIIIEAESEKEAWEIAIKQYGADRLNGDAYTVKNVYPVLNNTKRQRQTLAMIARGYFSGSGEWYNIDANVNPEKYPNDKATFKSFERAGLAWYCVEDGWNITERGLQQIIAWYLAEDGMPQFRIKSKDCMHTGCWTAEGNICKCKCGGKNHAVAA